MLKKIFYTSSLAIFSLASVVYADNPITTTPNTITNDTNMKAVSGYTASNNLSSPELTAKSYILMDYHSGRILASQNADQRQAPASLTKMMTSYIIGQALKQGRIKNTDIVTVPQSAWGGNPDLKGSSLMFIRIGQEIPVSELNKGIVVDSGNDACIAMAEYVSGTQETFVQNMNEAASKMNLKNTHFMTVHGLDHEGQYSSAHDMAILGRHLIKDLPEEYKLYAIKEFTFNGITQHNRNGLLWDKSLNVDGLKTGHTDEAGFNLVASATGQNNMRLISVVMGTPTQKDREQDSKKLLRWGFANFETLRALERDKPVVIQDVYYGKLSKVAIGSLQDAFITIPKGRSQDLKISYQFDVSQLEAPLSQGQIVGKIVYNLDGQTISQANLQVLQDVPEGNILGKIWDWILLKLKSVF